MTRKEYFKNMNESTYGSVDPIQIAIKALEQKPCEDAVSREAVLDIVRFEESWLSDAKSNNADTDIAFSGIRAQVAKLPPVTKALEPCEDCISREAALDKKWDVPYEGKYVQVVDVGDIKELPSVTPKKDGWIPCVERLPKQNEFDHVKYYLVQDKYGDMYVACHTRYGWHPIDALFFLNNIVAWMPLPEKYKTETEEEE